ncbi:MAG: extracellular solute-binding protein, partial [Erysipelotrichaceae bacterium]|nr:extracellular solute-binding protein [Erysipelotrichaceae bacterium]
MKKIITLLMISFMLLTTLTGCGGGGENGGNTKPDDGVIRVWVGEESAEFYQKACDEYVASHPDFGYKIEVKGMDTGSIAGTITNDPTAAADIYTVAHDNIGKLASTQCAKPITDESLIAQVKADNPASFQSVIYSTLNGTQYLYGVPYISQALFLYYNKALVTEEQAKTFEGLREAAKKAGTKAITVSGDDGFNMSFALLATKVADHSTTVRIYEGAESVSGGSKGKSNVQGDDTIAIFRWLQAYAEDPNGFKWASSDGWDADLDKDNKGVLAVIGGAWHYNTAKAALGETNLGITLIPTFKLTAEACEGLTGVQAGDEYRGGTFADCKCFMINAYSHANKYAKEQ